MSQVYSIIDSEVGEFNIPMWVKDLKTFRRWSEQDEDVEFGRIGYIRGRVWVDMSREQLYAHNAVKTEFTSTLHAFVKKNRMGRYFSDGAFLTNANPLS